MTDPREMLEAARQEQARALAAVEQWTKVVKALVEAVGGDEFDDKTGHIAEEGNGARRDLSELSWPMAARAVLIQAGHPLQVKDLVRVLQENGFKSDLTPRKARTNLVSAMIRRRDLFKKTGRARYGLAS